MHRESYWDYMTRRRREQKIEDLVYLIKELEHKVILLGGDPRQLELKV
jgi:hypothetical protein